MIIKRKIRKITSIVIVSVIISITVYLSFSLINDIRISKENDLSNVNKIVPILDVSTMIESDIIVWMSRNSDMPISTLRQVYETTRLYDNSDLVLAVSYVESRWNPYAKSFANAVGLMGVRPDVWEKELKKVGLIKNRRDLYLIDENLHSGVYILNQYVNKYKNLSVALDKYSGGATNYKNKVLTALGEIYLVRLNSNYVNKVNK